MSGIATAVVATGYMASKSASEGQAAATGAAQADIAEQKRQFEIVQEQTKPYREAGGRALSNLESMMYGGGTRASGENPYDAQVANIEEQIASYSQSAGGGGGFFGGGALALTAGAISSPEMDSLNAKLAAAKQGQAQWSSTKGPAYDLKKTPGYQFRLEEGYKGVERSQAGRRLSGRAAKEMSRYGQEYASSEFQNEFNRLSQIANYGVGGVAQSTQAGMQTGANISGAYQNIGAAGMAGAAGRNQALQGTAQNLMMWNMYNKPSPGGYGAPASVVASGDAYQPAYPYG